MFCGPSQIMGLLYIVSLVSIVLTHALYREKYTEKVYIIDDIFTKVQQKMS